MEGACPMMLAASLAGMQCQFSNDGEHDVVPVQWQWNLLIFTMEIVKMLVLVGVGLVLVGLGLVWSGCLVEFSFRCARF